MFTPQDFHGADPVWLFEMVWGGKTYRLSTQAITLSTASGTLSFEGGLDTPEWIETLDRLSVTSEGQSVSMEIIIMENVAKRRREGFGLGSATGELSMVMVKSGVSQQDYSERFRMVSGSISQPQYSDPLKPSGWMAFTLEELPYSDAGSFIDPSARVNKTTWPNLDEEIDGVTFPIVFGQPGLWLNSEGTTKKGKGSPAYRVDAGAGSEKLLIAGHHVKSATVRVFEGTSNDVLTVTNEIDGLGQQVATADLSAATSISKTAKEYWVCWDSDTAKENIYASRDFEGAGDICRWALNLSTIPVDSGRWAAVAQYLNRYKLGGFINDPSVTPWEWLSDNVIPLLPISVRRGPDGLYPIIDDPDVAPKTKITAGEGWLRISPVQVETRPDEMVNSITIEFASVGGSHKRSVTMTGNRDSANPDEFTSLYSNVSFRRYGSRSESITSDVVFDTSTAIRIVSEKSRRQGLVVESVTYECAAHWGWLNAGDKILVTDDDLSLLQVPTIVIGREWTGWGWSFTLLIEDDISRNPRAT